MGALSACGGKRYGTGKDAINRWRLSERAVLEQICREHGIEISAPEKSRGSLVVEEYKEYAKVKEQADEKRQEAEQLDKSVSDKQKLSKCCPTCKMRKVKKAEKNLKKY